MSAHARLATVAFALASPLAAVSALAETTAENRRARQEAQP